MALEVSDGQESEFLTLTGRLQALVRSKGYGTNQLLQDGTHPRRYYDIRIWRNADAAAKAESDMDIDGLRRDLAKHLHATPLVDVAWAVEVGLAAAGPWQEQRQLSDRRTGGDRRIASIAFSGPDRRSGLDRRSGVRRAGQPPLLCAVDGILTFGAVQRKSLEGPSSVVDRRMAIVHAARIARERATAAFSDFKVGAALEGADGRIFTGCNIENSTYGLTMCAERVAIFKAVSEGHRAFKRIAIVADTSQATSPCGACRQLLWEFAGDIEVILADLTGITMTHNLKDLLPHPFDARFIE